MARQLLAAYPRARCLLENERVGTGVFDLKSDDPETANGLSAVLWDLALLRDHYHPAVRAAAAEVARMPLAGAVAPALGSHAPSELARLHSTTRGNFRPAIPPPPARKKSKLSPLDRAVARGRRRAPSSPKSGRTSPRSRRGPSQIRVLSKTKTSGRRDENSFVKHKKKQKNTSNAAR